MNVKKWQASLMVLLGASSYGMLSPLIKLAYKQGVTEQQITVAMVSSAAGLLWLVYFLKRPRNKFVHSFRKLLPLLLVGAIGIGLTTIFYNIALGEMQSSLAIVLLFQFTWMVLVIEGFVTGIFPNRWKLLSVVLIGIGTVFSVNLMGQELRVFSIKGLMFGLLSGLTYAIFLSFVGRVGKEVDVWLKSALMITASTILIFLIFPPAKALHGSENLSSIWLWGVLAGLFGQVLPTLLFNLGIPKIGGGLAGMLGAIELPVAVMGSFLLLHEQVIFIQWFGIVVILAGIMISERASH